MVMTEQQIFDKVTVALIEQGGPSYFQGSCLYRGLNGRKCAAGHLIPDSMYRREYEQTLFNQLYHLAVDLKEQPMIDWLATFSEEAESVICDLQRMHDQAVTVNETDEHWLAVFVGTATDMAFSHKFDPTLMHQAAEQRGVQWKEHSMWSAKLQSGVVDG